MNHVYRLIWSDALGAFVVASENARARGKRNGLKLVSAAVLSVLAPNVHALPNGGQVSAGAGSIVQNGSAMTVNQSSQNLAVNWQSFNIGANESVNFIQPNRSAIALNRVLGSDPGRILGQISANGQVWILNPNGLLFGSSAQVNTGGFVASALNISDADFLAGKRSFSGNGGTVTNQGTITAAEGGYVALLGGQVSNEGVIAARLGTVALAAGKQVTLDFNGDQLLNVQVDQGALDALAQNKQLIRADGGTVLMTARAADALSAAAVNNEGVIEARSIENHGGVIRLLGDMRNGKVNVGGTLDASAPGGGNGGFIETSAAHVKVADSAQVTTAAALGLAGSWLIDPVDFTIAASGGDMTGATLSANLAGNVTIQSTSGATGTAGDINVNDAVTWSANTLTLNAQNNINVRANLNGSGTAKLALQYGQASVGGGSSDYILSGGAKIALPAGANFSTKLGTGGVTVNYTVITSLGAAGDATVAPGVMSLQGMNTGLAGNYALGGDIDASTTSGWNANAGFVPVGTLAANFTGSFAGLGHTITGLTINRLTTTYVGLFGYATGTLRDVGLLNSSIKGQSVVGALAGRSNGAISYSYADGGSVTTDQNIAGGLVGQLSGSIDYSYANVTVNSNSNGVSSTAIGGLVGLALAGSNIRNSYAAGSVSAGTYGGGLVGQNRANITNAYASGTVSCTTANCGGLIGDQLAGTITTSYWDSATTGRAAGTRQGAVAGLTDITSAPYAQASYTGFDFTNSWRIYEGHSRPLLKSFLTPITITANSASATYTGTASSGGGVSYSVSPNSRLLGGSVAGGGVNVGSYSLTPNGFYSTSNLGYDVSYVGGSLTVNKANLILGGSRAYDGTTVVAGSVLTATGVHGETFAVTGSGDASNLASKDIQSGSTLASLTGLALGTSSNGGLAGNYNALSTTGSSVSVTPKVLTVTANGVSKTYDGQAWRGNNGVSYSGLVNGETTAVLSGTLAYDGSAQGAVNAGSYSITPSGLTAANYTISYVDGTLTVTKAPLSVSANAVSKTYDGRPYSGGNGVSYSGFVNGETSAVLGGALAYGGSSQGAVKPGSYSITPSGLSSSNYAIGYVDGALTLGQASLTISANAASKSYDGQAWSGGNGVTYSGFVNGETGAVLGGALSYGGSSQGAVNAGNYAITPSGLTSANYAIRYVDGALTVSKVPLSISANAASKTYDGLAYSGGNGVSYSGFVNGETSAVLGGTLAYGGSAQGAIDAGNYVITPSGLSSSNYAISYVDGALTVAQAPLSVAANAVSKTYDGQAYSGGKVSYTGFVNGETSAVLGGTLAYGGSSQGAVNAGKYAITPSGLTSTNYAISYAAGALTIGQAPLSITANDAKKTYDTQAWSGGKGVTYSGFVNGETSAVLGGTLVYGGSSQGAVEVGKYAITLSGLDSNNYAITFNDGTLTVGARVPPVAGAPAEGYETVDAVETSTAAVHPDEAPPVTQLERRASFVARYDFEVYDCGLRLPVGVACQ